MPLCVCVRCLRLRVRGRYLPLPALSFAICSTAYHAHLVWAQINLHINFFVSPRPRTVGCCLRSGPGLVSWLWRLSSFIIPGQVNCQSDRRFAWSIEVYDKFSHFLEPYPTLPVPCTVISNCRSTLVNCAVHLDTSCPRLRRVPNDAWLQDILPIYFYLGLLTFFWAVLPVPVDCNCHFRLCQDDFIITAMPACQAAHPLRGAHVWQFKCWLSALIRKPPDKRAKITVIWHVWYAYMYIPHIFPCRDWANLCDGRKKAWPDCVPHKKTCEKCRGLTFVRFEDSRLKGVHLPDIQVYIAIKSIHY